MHMTDTFIKPVPGFDGCYADRAGNIWSAFQTGLRLRKPSPDLRYGYPTLKVKKDGKFRTYHAHTLVAKAFLPERPSPLHEVRHIDGNPGNTAVDNLKWGTPVENAADRKKHGRDKGTENLQKYMKTRVFKPKPICKAGHPRIPENLRGAACRICLREWGKLNQRKKRARALANKLTEISLTG